MQRSTHLVWWPTPGLIFDHSLGLGIGSGSNRSHCPLKSHSLWSSSRLLCGNSSLVGICWMSNSSNSFHQCWVPNCDIETKGRVPCPNTQARDPQGWVESRRRADQHPDPPQTRILLPKTLQKEGRRAMREAAPFQENCKQCLAE